MNAAPPAPYLDGLATWLEGTWLSSFMNWSAWAWPLCESLHFLGLTLLIGTVVLFDLSLLGWVKELAPAGFRPLERCGAFGFLLCAATGALFVVGIPRGYLGNPAFHWKVVFLSAALVNVLIYHRTVAGRVAALPPGGQVPGAARWMGGLSLLLWTAVLCAGRLVAFWKP